MANDNATTGDDNITQTSDPDTLTITNNDQIGINDFFDGAVGLDTIVILASGPDRLDVNLLALQTDSTHGLHNYEGVNFVSAAFSTVTADASQFGMGLISTSLALVGTDGFGAIFAIQNASNFSAENFTFANWEQTDGSNNDHHRIDLIGTDSGDTITGSDLSDFLIGNAGNDTLNSGEGDDFIGGGLGKDTMTGGDGIDNFYFTTKAESKKGAARDVILDFKPEDHIQLTDIDAKKGVGNQAFKFIGAKAFHDRPGELQVKYNANTNIAIVSGDINGDGKADFQIQVQSDTALVKDDFFL